MKRKATILHLTRRALPGVGAFYGRPLAGAFTTGLAALIAQTYAATGKQADLSLEDLNNPAVNQYGSDIESALHDGGAEVLLGDWRLADDYLARVLAVTAEQLHDVARRYLDPDALTLLLYRPTVQPRYAKQSIIVYDRLFKLAKLDSELRQHEDGVAIETRDVEVGTTVTNVQLPVVRMEDRQVEVPRVGVENEARPANAQ